MRYTPIRNISEDEKRELYDVLDDGIDIKYRAKIVLLVKEGYTVHEIRETWNIKRIFLVLDNASTHKSKKTKEALSKHHPRTTQVFLSTKSPKLNLIEVRWMWLQRKAIDNRTFRNQSDIGQAVQEWTENYNAAHGRRISDTLQIGVMHAVT